MSLENIKRKPNMNKLGGILAGAAIGAIWSITYSLISGRPTNALAIGVQMLIWAGFFYFFGFRRWEQGNRKGKKGTN